ncbi:hypothetical protein Btru_001953 [Bulinus truncatus]|nr:hypothetical protein Btru_001953 [Bulinus truncatus]
MNQLLRHLWAWRTVMILLLTPIIISPIITTSQSQESKCAFVVLLMAVYWITETLPMGVTALLPVFLFPLFGIVSPGEIASQYMNDVNMVFIGGLMMAIAIEYWELHRRVALKVMLLAGSEARWLMLGMMIATWFLSMWISNTATTAMMIPIAEAILVQLKGTSSKLGKGEVKVTGNNCMEMTVTVTTTSEMEKLETLDQGNSQNGAVGSQAVVTFLDSDDTKSENDSCTETDDDNGHFTRLSKAMSLCICYAANSGGIGSLTGTGPNLVLKGSSDQLYAKYNIKNPVSFGSWMAFGIPLSIIILLVCWTWLQVAFLRCRGACGCCVRRRQDTARSERIRKVIQSEYDKLGPMVFGQLMVLILFCVLITLWITRDLGGVVGWSTLLGTELKDGGVAIIIAVLLFGLPSTLPCLKSYSDPAHPQKSDRDSRVRTVKQLEIRPLLNWRAVHEKMPWHLFLLLGGGYALSKGCMKSGLSIWIGHQLEFFSGWNQWGILFIICYITAAATEVTSNTAIATLLMPIMSELAITTAVHPLYYMIPTALACSFAFMLPVATPPNAIVFAYGRISILDMLLSGLVLNILAVPCLVAVTGTIGNAVFAFDSVPTEFINGTMI